MKTKKKPTKSKAIEIQPFEVRVPWVRVQVFELKMIVDYLLNQSPKIVSNLGKDVASYALSYNIHPHKQTGLEKAYIQGASDLRGRKLREITIVMNSQHWKQVLESARLAEVEPAVIVRYGLGKRWRQLKEYHRTSQKSVMEIKDANRA